MIAKAIAGLSNEVAASSREIDHFSPLTAIFAPPPRRLRMGKCRLRNWSAAERLQRFRGNYPCDVGRHEVSGPVRAENSAPWHNIDRKQRSETIPLPLNRMIDASLGKDVTPWQC